MTATFTKVFQGIALAAQIAVQVQSVLPPKAQAATATTVALLQAIQGIIAHYHAPDGSKLPPQK